MDNILLEKVQEIVLTEAAKNNRISERALAEIIGLSRTPIRESLQHLEEHGLIDRRHRAGIRLRKIPLGELLEIYDLRGLLEGLACRMLAERRDEVVLLKLHRANEEYLQVTGPGGTEAESDQKDIVFHRLIIENCGACRLPRMVNILRIITRSFGILPEIEPGMKKRRRSRYRYRRSQSHEKIIAALAEGNPSRAEKAMRLHIEEAKQNLVHSTKVNCTRGKTGGKEVI